MDSSSRGVRFMALSITNIRYCSYFRTRILTYVNKYSIIKVCVVPLKFNSKRGFEMKCSDETKRFLIGLAVIIGISLFFYVINKDLISDDIGLQELRFSTKQTEAK